MDSPHSIFSEICKLYISPHFTSFSVLTVARTFIYPHSHLPTISQNSLHLPLVSETKKSITKRISLSHLACFTHTLDPLIFNYHISHFHITEPAQTVRIYINIQTQLRTLLCKSIPSVCKEIHLKKVYTL